jgi:SAM-dependent methyltransferase
MTSSTAARNAEFWDEACGTTLAQSMGITDFSAASLARFDERYFSQYPFLADYFPASAVAGRRVLEIGLGYGSLSQRLMDSGAIYQGLDIAAGPVGIVNIRARHAGKPPPAALGDALRLPFADNTFDFVCSIGCLHHTGDTQRAVQELLRTLQPGGQAVVMIYNALCYKNWIVAPGETLRTLLRRPDPRGSTGSPRLRAAHDRNVDGQSPPETAFHKAADMAGLFAGFSVVRTRKENCYLRLPQSMQKTRAFALRTLGRCCGLNLYISAKK